MMLTRSRFDELTTGRYFDGPTPEEQRELTLARRCVTAAMDAANEAFDQYHADYVHGVSVPRPFATEDEIQADAYRRYRELAGGKNGCDDRQGVGVVA